MKKNHLPESVFPSKEMLLDMKKKASAFSLGKNKLQVTLGFGEHKSPFKTKGLDFQEVRVYQPGDDIRLIDWKITAKHNKPFTKLYTDEKERQVFIIADMRSHMQFATKGFFKSVITANSTAFIAFLAENKKDKIGFCIIENDKLECALPQTGNETLISLIDSLERVGYLPEEPIREDISLFQALSKSEKFIRPGAMVFVLSDFVDLDKDCSDIIRRISKKATCSLIHIYDELEKSFPKGIYPITDGKDFVLLNSNTKTFIDSYVWSFEKVVESLYESAKNERVGYLSLSTQSDFVNQIAFYCKGGLV